MDKEKGKDFYVNLIIHDISVLLSKNSRPYWVLHFETSKYQGTPPSVKVGRHTWTKQGITIPISPDQVLTHSIRIELYDKGKKLLGGDAFLGEVTVPVKQLLLRHVKLSSEDEGSGEKVILLGKDKAKAEVTIWAEASGWAHFNSLLQDKKTQKIAISDLITLAKRTQLQNSSFQATAHKLAEYMKPDVYNTLLTLTKKAIKKKHGKKTKDDKPDKMAVIFEMWEWLCKEMKVRSKLVELEFLDTIKEFISMNNPEVSSHFLECLKNFFTTSGNQRLIINNGLLDVIIKQLTTTTPNNVLAKLCQVLRYFDVSHISTLLEKGLLQQLRHLLSSDSASVLEQALETITYIGPAYKEQMLNESIAPAILKLITSSDARVKLKAIDIFEKFKFPQDEQFTSSKITSLLDSFTPDLPPITRCKLLKRLEEETIVGGDIKTGVVSERKRILDILVKCLGDSNTVVQLEANRIVQTLVGVTPEEFVEVSILDAYRQLLNNPKIPSTQHNYIFNALQKSYKDHLDAVIKSGIPKSAVNIISDTRYESAVRIHAMEFIHGLPDHTFINVVRDGALRNLLDYTGNLSRDASDEAIFVAHSIIWTGRVIDIERASGINESDMMYKELMPSIHSVLTIYIYFTSEKLYSVFNRTDYLKRFLSLAKALLHDPIATERMVHLAKFLWENIPLDLRVQAVDLKLTDWLWDAFRIVDPKNPNARYDFYSFIYELMRMIRTERFYDTLIKQGIIDSIVTSIQAFPDNTDTISVLICIIQCLYETSTHPRSTFKPVIEPLSNLLNSRPQTTKYFGQIAKLFKDMFFTSTELREPILKANLSNHFFNLHTQGIDNIIEGLFFGLALFKKEAEKNPQIVSTRHTFYDTVIRCARAFPNNIHVLIVLLEVFQMIVCRNKEELLNHEAMMFLVNQQFCALPVPKKALVLLNLLLERIPDVFTKLQPNTLTSMCENLLKFKLGNNPSFGLCYEWLKAAHKLLTHIEKGGAQHYEEYLKVVPQIITNVSKRLKSVDYALNSPASASATQSETVTNKDKVTRTEDRLVGLALNRVQLAPSLQQSNTQDQTGNSVDGAEMWEVPEWFDEIASEPLQSEEKEEKTGEKDEKPEEKEEKPEEKEEKPEEKEEKPEEKEEKPEEKEEKPGEKEEKSREPSSPENVDSIISKELIKSRMNSTPDAAEVCELAMEILYEVCVITVDQTNSINPRQDALKAIGADATIKSLLSSTPSIVATTFAVFAYSRYWENTLTDSIISIIPKIDLETAMRVLKHASSKKAQLRIIYSLALMGSPPSLSPATMLDEAIEMGVIDIVKDIVNQQNSSGISSADVFQLLISIATRKPEMVAQEFPKTLALVFGFNDPTRFKKGLKFLSYMKDEKSILSCVQDEQVRKAISSDLRSTGAILSSYRASLLYKLGKTGVKMIAADVGEAEFVDSIVYMLTGNAEYNRVLSYCATVLHDLLTDVNADVEKQLLARNIGTRLTNIVSEPYYNYLIPAFTAIIRRCPSIKEQIAHEVITFFQDSKIYHLHDYSAHVLHISLLISESDEEYRKQLADSMLVPILTEQLQGFTQAVQTIDLLYSSLLLLPYLKTNSSFMKALTSKIESALKNLAYNTFLFVVEHIDRVVHAKPNDTQLPAFYLEDDNAGLIFSADRLKVASLTGTIKSCKANKCVKPDAGIKKMSYSIQILCIPTWGNVYIGWCTKEGFALLNSEFNKFVGSAKGTWGINLVTHTAYVEGEELSYTSTATTTTSSQVTCTIDCELKQISFSLSSHGEPIKLTDLKIDTEELYPCISISRDVCVSVNYKPVET